MDIGLPAVRFSGADPLPVGPFTGLARDVLDSNANVTIGILFEGINRFRRIVDQAERSRNLPLETYANSKLCQHATKVIELTLGRSVNLTVGGQSQLPKWDKLSPEFKQQFFDEMKRRGAALPPVDVQDVQVLPSNSKGDA